MSDAPESRPADRTAPRSASLRTARLIAVIAGLAGVLLAVLTPLLPVKQTTASVSWPQDGALTSVSAPLIGYEPISVSAHIPCPVATQLPPDGQVLVSTAPKQAADAELDGLTVKVSGDAGSTDRDVQVVLRNSLLLSAPLADVAAGCSAITVFSDADHTTATFAGLSDTEGNPLTVDVAGDLRPQMVGIFSDLQGAAPAGLEVRVDVDSRFSSSPTPFKLLAMIVGALATLIALFALHRLDSTDGRAARRFLPGRWWRFTGVDALVVGTLALWHFIGANTSDDGYLLNMARVSDKAGYMANYFRWFGVPEAPFGWYYDVLVAMAKIGTASTWMRLPALIAGILCWMVISREVIPRLGNAVRRNRIAVWTAALVFLAFWLPYNNGLRPEPIIALGALLTWCSIERAIATGRLLPAAVGVLIAAFSLAAGPTGVIAVAALIVGTRPIAAILVARARRVGWLPLLAPIAAAGTVVLGVVFADQTLATVLEATRVRTLVGPNVQWFDEYHRYDALMNVSPDGSLARRFGVFTMILCLVVCAMIMLRRGGRIPGAAAGPSRRILGIVFGSLVLMMFTPTKWTHHFGVYAGLAGSIGALTAVAVAAATLRSRRNRTLFAAGVLFLLALAFTGSNGWWYVSSYGVPWWDKPPSIGGNAFSTALLGLAVLTLLLAGWQHLRAPYRPDEPAAPARGIRALLGSPLTLAAAFVVLFEVLSLAKAAVAQYPAYSVARSNVETLAGNTCALADDVLVESDANAGMLAPVTPSDNPLGADADAGFTPNGVPVDLTADEENKAAGGANTTDNQSTTTTSGTASGTGGGTGHTGINGSSVALPFGLDPASTPVLGSYQTGEQATAKLTSGWYRMPERSDAAPILAVTAAGRIRSVDSDGVVTYGQDLVVEYGAPAADGTVEVRGSLLPIDIGPSPSWRNLRIPMADIPADATAVRLVANDHDLSQGQWLAVTPPRIPQLRTLNEVVGSTAPVLLDWSVGLSFPCQRPFDHEYGVAEVPDYRILPDRVGADATNGWQDSIGGGPLGWTDLLLTAQTMPSYLDRDWDRDWGSLERYSPLDESAVPARVDTATVTRSGLWDPGPIPAR